MIARRRLLWLPLALAAWPRRCARADAVTAAAGGSLEAFIAAAQPIARRLVADGSPAGQDAYLYQLASAAVRLHEMPPRQLFPLAPGVELAPAWRGVPFFVIEWRLAPHARLPPHDHPSYSVCTVVLDGETEVEHYEPVAGTSQLRKTRAALLGRGAVDTLSAFRDNVHGFRAGPRGAHGLDVTTLYGVDRGFHWIDIARDAAVGETVAVRLRSGQP